MDLIDVYRTFHPNSTRHTFFLDMIFSKIDHILGQKASLNEYKKIDIPCIVSDHNAIKLELKNKK
jgi:endonuclease/exonuclease/phosphatase family metal-dependent hydrolase